MNCLVPHLDPPFRDWNLSSLRDYAWPVRVPADEMTRLFESKTDDELVNVIVTTLSEGSFEAFLRAHGPRAIGYSDWRLYKAIQFFELLGFGNWPDNLRECLESTRTQDWPWLDIIRWARADPGGDLRECLPTGPQAPPTVPPRRGWGRNLRRNEIIQACQQRGEDGAQICDALDRQAIPVIESLSKHEVTRWTDGWSDPELRPHIQQLLSKRKRKRVKP